MHPLLQKALLRVVLHFAYGLLFSWIFTLIEKRDESALERMERTLSELKKEIDLNYNMTDNDFESFVRRSAAAVKDGDELDWTFLNSCGFVFAALTTIGYGNLTPKTQLGQGITIIVCLIGIPITMLAYKATGELVATCIAFLIVKTETVILKRAEPKDVKKKTFFTACSLMVVLLILGSVWSIFLEGWSFVEGLYAWFVTFTTMGFGDYVLLTSTVQDVDHGESSKAYLILYGILYALPIMIGLTFTSCIFTCIADSIDQIREFRDRFQSCWPNITSRMRGLLCRDMSNYDVRGEDNQENCTPQEIS